MRAALFLAFAAWVSTTACTKVELTSSSSRDGVPQVLQGEWTGAWTSSGSAGTGAVAVTLLSFEQKPVVRLRIDNPCIGEARYDLRLVGTRFELLADGEPVFVASLDPQRRELRGSYGCPEDQGEWHVAWQRDLAPIQDLGGTWYGSYQSSTPLVFGTFSLALDQRWRNGALVLLGELALDGYPLPSAPARGYLEWHGDTFEVQLEGVFPGGPLVRFAGVGRSNELVITDGVVLADPDPRLPFRTGLWNATWIRR